MAVEEVTFNLVASVMALVEDMPGASVVEIAERLVDEIPDSEKESILRKAMTQEVRRIIGRDRRRAMDPSAPYRFELAQGVAWEVRLLRSSVLVHGSPKRLGEMDLKDCMDACRERENHARQTAHRAKQFKALAAILNKRGLATVAEIPVEDLKKVFHA